MSTSAAAKKQFKRRFKNAIYGALARVPSAIANPGRLELLELLAQRPRTVQDVAAESGLTIANASQHLQVLARCGLVSAKRQGKYIAYQTAGSAVLRLLVAVREVAVQNDTAIGIVLDERASTRAAGIDDLVAIRALIADPRTALLDARPPEEFAAGHLPHAINAPLDALKSGKIGLTKSKRYAVYCRGPYCVFADEVVELLHTRGIEALRVALGPNDWEAAGEPLERTG